MKAIILGCGPAGLLTAEACHACGLEVDIFSIKQKSPILGAQFLHEPIPNINDDKPDGHIVFAKVGTKAGYAKKVYGDSDAPCSWDQYQEGLQPAWSLKQTYEVLWDKFADRVNDLTVTQPVLSSLEEREAEFMFSTIPARVLCQNADHRFTAKTVWIEGHSNVMVMDIAENTVIYNGVPSDPWYRASNLWGHKYTEFATPREAQHSVTGEKPLATNCTCRPKWERLGRFGKWDKSVLTHHAYGEALLAIQGGIL